LKHLDRSIVDIPSSDDGVYQKIAAGLRDVYVIVDNEVFERTGITSNQPEGKGWRSLGVKGAKDIAITEDQLIILLSNGDVVRKPCKFRNINYIFRISQTICVSFEIQK